MGLLPFTGLAIIEGFILRICWTISSIGTKRAARASINSLISWPPLACMTLRWIDQRLVRDNFLRCGETGWFGFRPRETQVTSNVLESIGISRKIGQSSATADWQVHFPC